MKRYICLLLSLVLALALAGCGSSSGTSGKAGSQSAGVNDVLEQGMAEADSNSNSDNAPSTGVSANDQSKPSREDTKAPNLGTMPKNGAGSIDVDLTFLSSTMVYSQVSNMLSSPDKYIGKTVKMDGLFTFYHDETTGNNYYACIIPDATACCAQGIEFVLTDDYTFPDDYPEPDAEICVAGVFSTYVEDDITYCALINARLL